MSGISLSAGVRQNLLALQDTASLLAQTQNRLATGKKVNSALDNPNSFFTAQGLSNRANDLSNLLDGITNGINTIQAANNGITAITKLVQSAQSLVTQAQQTTDTTIRASLATQFGAIRTQIDQLAGDSGYNGTNLLGGNDLTVTLNETGTSTATVTAVDDTTTGDLDDFGCGQRLGRQYRHRRGGHRSDRCSDHAAVAVGRARFGPVDHPDPRRLHQGNDQHAADWFGCAHGRRQQRGRRQLAGVADSSVAVHDGPVAVRSVRPQRAQAVRRLIHRRYRLTTRRRGPCPAVVFLPDR